MVSKPKIFVIVNSTSRQTVSLTTSTLNLPERIYSALSHVPSLESIKTYGERKVTKDHIRVPQAGNKKITNFRLPISNLQNFWKGEEYVMVIDGDSSLEKGWDVELLAMLRRCHSRKSIITTNPDFFSPGSEFSKSDVVRHWSSGN